MKNLYSFGNFKGNFAIFSNAFKILSNFWQKCGQKFRNIKKYAFVGGSRAEPPTLANLWKSA